MDIESLKDKLGDETFAKLQTYVTDLIGQRDAARNESITGRKGLKGQLETLQAAQAKLLEKLGIDSIEEVDTLPDGKGAAEANKQLAAQLKRLQGQVETLTRERDETSGKLKNTLQRAAVAEAMGGHEFVARDIVETFVSQRLVWEGDDLLFKDDSGKLLPVRDGVAGIAKARPELLKAQGAGGAGARPAGGAGSGAGGKTMTRSEFDQADQAARADFVKAGGKVVSD